MSHHHSHTSSNHALENHEDHHHDDHDHDHDHDHSSDIQPALQSLLYKQIDFPGIVTLNESVVGNGMRIVKKPWDNRMSVQTCLTSDADEQILMTVPFSGTVKLHSILIRTSLSPSAPRTLKLFLNREDLDFDAVSSMTPVQTLSLAQTADVQDVPVKRALFGNTYFLTMFFEDNYGEETTGVYYVGFRGEWLRLNREPVEVLYERAANPRDHKAIVGTGGLVEYEEL